MSRSRAAILMLVATVLVTLTLVPAAAQQPLGVEITETELEEDGATTVVATVTGDATDERVLPVEAFSVTDGGKRIGDVEVRPLVETAHTPISAGVVLDTSGSTQGPALEAAVGAARTFVADLTDRGVPVELTTFADTAGTAVPFTAHRAELTLALDALTADGETALYDAIVLAGGRLADREGQRHLVVFTDGGDTASRSGLGDARESLARVGVEVTVVALDTGELDVAALEQLTAAPDARLISVDKAGRLAAAFERVVREIASQYVLAYTGTAGDGETLDIAVTVTADGGQARDVATVLDTRRVPASDLPAADIRGSGPVPVQVALWIGIGTAFVALAVLFGFLVLGVTRDEASRPLRRALRVYADDGRDVRGELSVQQLTTTTAALIDGLPRPRDFDSRMQLLLDQAGWQMRATELLAIQLLGAMAALAVTAALTGSPVVALVGAGLGAVAPRLVLSRRATTRQAAFLEQLPDTLNLLSSSLRAGYGLLQAVDTVVKEAPAPTAEEFGRALTETRLGRPLDEALDSMAARLGSEDFSWVVLAVNIQNEIGGNLATLLETVSRTLRERGQVRRQVQVLSAEGRLSAVVLLALPVVLAVAMSVINPEYTGLLFGTFPGRMMVLGALAFSGIGMLWMRKVVAIEV